MKHRKFFLVAAFVLLVGGSSWAYFQDVKAGPEMTAAAEKYLASLDADQLKMAQLDFADTAQRTGWHFIPKDQRKGVQIREMNKEQREAAQALLRSCLSKVGYEKATQIIALEALLKELEKDKSGTPLRDTERYYFTVFGKPDESSRWGLSIEGHHLSLNFVVDKNEVISSTPTLMASNPAEVKSVVPGEHGIKQGTRVLANEELVAFELIGSLTEAQLKSALLAETAPKEIRGAGEAQPPAEAAVGISYGELNERQRDIMKRLVGAYLENMPTEVQQQRIRALIEGGVDGVKFAWAGATKPGVGHYYRIQGPSFLIEFVNVQPDAAGNPANHIHAVWRDMQGDFAIPITK